MGSPDETMSNGYNIHSQQVCDYSKSYFPHGHNQQRFFPEGFVPRYTDVIIGKGMRAFSHVGNERLRDIIASRLQEYENMRSKKERSDVISSIVAETRAHGSFIKKDANTGLWFEADEVLARDKISQAFRNLKNKSRHRSAQPALCCSSTSRQSSVSRPQNLAISDRMSSINSIDLATNLRSCVPLHSFEVGSNPFEPICISPFDTKPLEATSMSMCYDNVDQKCKSYGPYEPKPYRHTSQNQFS